MRLSLFVWKTEIRLSIRRRDNPRPLVVAAPPDDAKWVSDLVEHLA